ncbi:acyl carrier protein [Streptomyces sp. AM 3-1-1]|uniref:acyl carrier protein n=1 Tax=Streptomyces sp. AM 3-1-1 TaxID=3028711 RepID=UPI0023B8EAD6|nr:acyl carrier protein [Streptomyces sp. AM 3-1-1]WEH30874.1 acyl carrier protein [Streptomyces sp. AM 3-1-1]
MSALTVDDLKKLLAETAGEDDSVDLAGELDTPFVDLGYDSLALLETAAVLQQRYGIALTEETVGRLGTPRELLDEVNTTPATA